MNNKAFASVIVLLILLVIGVAAGMYLLMSNGGGFLKNQPQAVSTEQSEDKMMKEEIPISEDNDIKTLEAELEATTVGDLEADFKDLDQDSSSL